jgi:hypothetical protein
VRFGATADSGLGWPAIPSATDDRTGDGGSPIVMTRMVLCGGSVRCVWGCGAKAPAVGAVHAKKGRPYAGRPFLVEVVGQRPLPKVGVTELTVARCWMSCTQSW